MQRYYLRDGVSFCGQGDAIVFLSLEEDEYTMLAPDETRVFRGFFLERQPKIVHEASGSSATDKLLHELVAARILTTSAEAGKTVTPTIVEQPRQTLTTGREAGPAALSTRAVLYFMWACLSAALRLRMQPIARVVRRVARRKAARRHSSASRDPHDIEVTVATFFRLRALFPRNYLCLFDSLALLEFLSAYDFFPQWVFGVRTEPWAAHCWVQQGDVLLNDNIEEISDYIPILAV